MSAMPMADRANCADLYIIYVTAKDQAEAERIGLALLERRLVACANVIDGVRSIYWWQGEIQDSAEAVLIAKTQKSRLEELILTVKQLHSYECPCIVAAPISAGNPDFLKWIRDETTQEQI